MNQFLPLDQHRIVLRADLLLWRHEGRFYVLSDIDALLLNCAKIDVILLAFVDRLAQAMAAYLDDLIVNGDHHESNQ